MTAAPFLMNTVRLIVLCFLVLKKLGPAQKALIKKILILFNL